VLDLETFIWDKFAIWASIGKWMEEIWKNFKETIYDGIECSVPH